MATLFMLMVCLPIQSLAQPGRTQAEVEDNIVGDIRMEAYRMRQATGEMKQHKVQLKRGELYGPAMLEGWTDNEAVLRRLSYVNHAGLPDTVVNYTFVFDDFGEVIYIEEEVRLFKKNAQGQLRPTGVSTKAYFYFYNGTLIRWLNHQRKRVSPESKDYQARGEVLQYMGTQLRDIVLK